MILLLVFAENAGMKGVEWVPVIGCVIAIIFGLVLLLCCREGANRLSWRKRMLLYGVLDSIEEKELKDTELGIRAGSEGAWIELGNKASLGKYPLIADKFRPASYTVIQSQATTTSAPVSSPNNKPAPTGQPGPTSSPMQPPIQSSSFRPAENNKGGAFGGSNMGDNKSLQNSELKQSVVCFTFT
jgi:hypothetical protein